MGLEKRTRLIDLAKADAHQGKVFQQGLEHFLGEQGRIFGKPRNDR